ncbi:hypothetical protein [Mucilaginibacter flavus]|uniref:hypothetical protein n=1 Tax=Mucilaginibacter flavus TaxID=931504 RepID=UPI0025B28199|nr:hypothetical protein [Mucilaginibacter flavus]MDN3581717.1 hypothetical protein [Mucilaginibacter flavus]
MSTVLTEVKDGQVYTGFDTSTAAQYCTPSYLGCSACLGASVIDGYVALTISVNTPFGGVTKTFKITQGGTFTWQPYSKFKVVVSINNFSEQGGTFSFDAGIQVCIDVPFLGWKCVGYSHHFSIPTLHALAATNELSDVDFSGQLALLLLLEQNNKCNCH